MNYILLYKQKLTELIAFANVINISNTELIAHEKKVNLHIKQQKCIHDLEVKTIGNVRQWQCKKCKKIIDYETIK